MTGPLQAPLPSTLDKSSFRLRSTNYLSPKALGVGGFLTQLGFVLRTSPDTVGGQAPLLKVGAEITPKPRSKQMRLCRSLLSPEALA
jgi:hypothetical protein